MLGVSALIRGHRLRIILARRALAVQGHMHVIYGTAAIAANMVDRAGAVGTHIVDGAGGASVYRGFGYIVELPRRNNRRVLWHAKQRAEVLQAHFAHVSVVKQAEYLFPVLCGGLIVDVLYEFKKLVFVELPVVICVEETEQLGDIEVLVLQDLVFEVQEGLQLFPVLLILLRVLLLNRQIQGLDQLLLGDVAVVVGV